MPKPFAEIPGPPRRFLIGELPTLAASPPWEVCADYARAYGPITRIHVPGKHCVVLNDPDLISEVLIENTGDYWRDRPREAVLPVGSDDSAFLSPGGDHWAERRSWHPLTHDGVQSWLDGLVQQLVPVARTNLQRWRNEGPTDAAMATHRLACDLLFTAYYGSPVSDEDFALHLQVAERLDARMQWRWPFKKPIWGPEQRTYDAWQQRGEKRFEQTADADGLAEILRRGGRVKEDARMARLLNSVLLEGGFSSAGGIAMTLHGLTHAPGWRTRVREALRALPRPLTWQALDACEPLDFVLLEALRLHPPVPIFFRNSDTEREITLGDWTLPPNTVLFITNWWLQRESDHWDEPGAFRPERWSDGVAAANPYGSGHFSPFGRGPRSCAGEKLALLVQKVALAVLLEETDVELDTAPGTPDFELFFATLRLAGANLIAREAAVSS